MGNPVPGYQFCAKMWSLPPYSQVKFGPVRNPKNGIILDIRRGQSNRYSGRTIVRIFSLENPVTWRILRRMSVPFILQIVRQMFRQGFGIGYVAGIGKGQQVPGRGREGEQW